MYGTEGWRINLLIRTLATRHRTYAAIRLARIGLYPGQEVVLLVLDRFGAMTQRQLVDRLGIEPPTLSTVARKLEAGGFISREPSTDDRRATIVTITGKGRDLLPVIREIGRDVAETTLDGMDEETVQVLMRSMLHAIHNLEDRSAARRLEQPDTST